MTDEVSCPAQIVKVQTMVDGGIRFTFDVAETEELTAAQLMRLKRLNVVGLLVFRPLQNSGGAVNAEGQAIPARRKRKSKGQAAKTEGADGDFAARWIEDA